MAQSIKHRLHRSIKLLVITTTPLILGSQVVTAPPRPTAGEEAVTYMSKYGIIEDQANWQRMVTKTHRGRDVHTLNELNVLLSAANRHSSAAASLQRYENLNYPVTTRVQGLTLINVPSFYSTDSKKQQRYVQRLDRLIRHSGPTVYLNFVNNTGGAADSMTAGLTALIPNGRLWTEIDKTGHRYPANLTKTAFNEPEEHFRIKVPQGRKLLDRNVVILINEHTASAAEFSILALKRNPRCTVIGTPSMGLTSGNTGKVLGKEHWQGVLTTRTVISSVPIHGRTHFKNDRIQPDIWTSIVPSQSENYLDQTDFTPGFIDEVKRTQRSSVKSHPA